MRQGEISSADDTSVLCAVASVTTPWVFTKILCFFNSTLAFLEDLGFFLVLFIHCGYLYSATSRNLLRGALSPATSKEKCLAEGRHIVPGQLSQRNMEFIPSGGANLKIDLVY